MVFNSITFLAFFPIVFLLYWLVIKRESNLQNLLLLLASYVFYAAWDWRFLSLIIISSTVDFFVGKQLGRSTDQRERRILLLISLGVNLLFLWFFKYFNFFVDSFALLFTSLGIEVGYSTLNIVLPVGISFYTFQTLSYTIDIYRRKINPTDNALTFFTFVAFFPQLVAGPIERASNLIPQFSETRKFSYDMAASGCRLMLWGFFKKIVIADGLAYSVEQVYADPAGYSGYAVWIATFFFGLQVYCDFSGYSDIAIGAGRMFGIRLMTNFRTPFFATSIREHWQRWHISLTTWFRDYVYISLGGNRVSTLRWAFNVFITFVISGLWHGANFTFIIWGALHGLVFLIESVLSKATKFTLPKFLKLTYTLVIVFVSYMFFRAESLTDALVLLQNSFVLQNEFSIDTMASLFKEFHLFVFIIPSLIIFCDIRIDHTER